MTKANALVLGFSGMLVLCLSIPMEWMTVHNAKMTIDPSPGLTGDMPDLSRLFAPMMNGMSVVATGLTGHVTILAKVPIWAVVVLGLFGAAVALLNSLKITSFPRIVVLVPLLLSALHVLSILLIPWLSDGEGTLGIGAPVALTGLTLAMIQVMISKPQAVKLAQ
jgi:hypothetical protein